MIFYAKDRVENIRAGAQGGTGRIVGSHPFAADARPENTHFRMVGQMALAPGSSIGFHVHQNDEEIYLITGGRGAYTDADRKEYAVAAGDLTLTRQGEGHGLANTGDEPLTFVAVIAA